MSGWSVDERAMLMEWLRAHDVDPGTIPYNADFACIPGDPPVWEVEQYVMGERGRIKLDGPYGNALKQVVRFEERTPWPVPPRPKSTAFAAGWQAAIAALRQESENAFQALDDFSSGIWAQAADYLESIAPKEGTGT